MSGNKALNYLVSCLIFIGTIACVFGNFEMTLTDSDTGWHLAAGDLIRATGAIPKTDPWSFTSGGVPWLNAAWLWDVGMSFLTQYLGWYGQIACLSVCIAATMVTLYWACIIASGNATASFLTVLLALISIPLHLRSLWITNLFLAWLFLLALLVQYRGWNIKWWYAMPALMPLWVNLHGGFIIAFVLLGAFGLQALLKRQWPQVIHLTAAGILSLAMIGINPYGYSGITRLLWQTFTTPARAYIGEYQAIAFSFSAMLLYLYVPVFIATAMIRKIRLPLAETILGFMFLPLGCNSERYLTYFILFSCPILARYFTPATPRQYRGYPPAMRAAASLRRLLFVTHAKCTATLITATMTAAMVFLFSPYGARTLGFAGYYPYANFLPATTFIREHYPHYRFFNQYRLGGMLIEQTRGAIPVFVDGRGETAYPRQIVKDYPTIIDANPHWEQLLDSYHVDGVILSIDRDVSMPHFEDRHGWKRTYLDKYIAVYLRDR